MSAKRETCGASGIQSTWELKIDHQPTHQKHKPAARGTGAFSGRGRGRGCWSDGNNKERCARLAVGLPIHTSLDCSLCRQAPHLHAGTPMPLRPTSFLPKSMAPPRPSSSSRSQEIVVGGGGLAGIIVIVASDRNGLGLIFFLFFKRKSRVMVVGWANLFGPGSGLGLLKIFRSKSGLKSDKKFRAGLRLRSDPIRSDLFLV